jgi:hypothetical protein
MDHELLTLGGEPIGNSVKRVIAHASQPSCEIAAFLIRKEIRVRNGSAGFNAKRIALTPPQTL